MATRVQPLIHVFGHIHEGYGVSQDAHTTYINASVLDEDYRCINPAVVFDLMVQGGHTHKTGTEPGGASCTDIVRKPLVVTSQVRSWSKWQVADWVARVRRKQKEELKKWEEADAITAYIPSLANVWSKELSAFLSTLSGSELLSLSRDFVFRELKSPCLKSVQDRVQLMLAIRNLEAKFTC